MLPESAAGLRAVRESAWRRWADEKDSKIKPMDRMLGAELTAHLGYEEGKDAALDQPNRRNGTTSIRLKGRDG